MAGTLEIGIVLAIRQSIKNDARNTRQVFRLTQQNGVSSAQLQARAGDFVLALVCQGHAH